MSINLDSIIFVTNPPEMGAGFTPLDLDQPNELVWCCFFRTVEGRAEFLQDLRNLAANPIAPDSVDYSPLNALSRDYEESIRAGDSAGAFRAAATWWIGIMRQTYHSYSLRIGIGPYKTSCVVSFLELSAEVIRRNVSRASREMEGERAHVMDAFGLA